MRLRERRPQALPIDLDELGPAIALEIWGGSQPFGSVLGPVEARNLAAALVEAAEIAEASGWFHGQCPGCGELTHLPREHCYICEHEHEHERRAPAAPRLRLVESGEGQA